MPWTVKDVEKYKKGLTDKQKSQWVRIANSILAKCIADGGTDETCTPKAIRQANGTVNNNNMETNFCIHSIQTDDYRIRIKMYQKRKHIIVPVVMMVEGVHSGSHGAILHTQEELAKFTGAWNGRPVTVNHPQQDGMNLSAADSPEVMEQTVGTIFHTKMEDGKLKAEAWLDEEKLTTVSPTVLSYIKQGLPLDVSVGVFTDSDMTEGEWNGEQYTSIARNYRPDHLALLPGGRGACSWNDGCGVRINNEGGNSMDFSENLKQLNQHGFAAYMITNEQGMMERLDLIRGKINAMDNETSIHYLGEVFDNYLIYSKSIRGVEGFELFRQDYRLTDQDTKIEFVGDPVKVRRNVEYIAMSMQGTNDLQNNNSKKGGKVMANEKSPCCLAKIEQLISHKLTNFTDADKEWLLSLEEAVIDKLFPIEQKPEPAPQVNKTKALEVLSTELKTVEDYVAIMPKEIQDQVNVGIATYKEKRQEKIQLILDNAEKDVWTKEELETMTDSMLDKLNKTLKVHNYSGMGGNPPKLEKTVAPLKPTGM